MSKVYVAKTTPTKVVSDYQKLLRKANYKTFLKKNSPIVLKLNLSWTKFYPACSTPPWELEGVVKTLIEDGFKPSQIIPVENKTVVTDVRQGSINNSWLGVLKKYNLKMTYLTDVPYKSYKPKHKLFVLDKIFPDGILLPKIIFGANMIHLPTIKCIHPRTKIFLDDGRLIEVGQLIDDHFKRAGVCPFLDEDGDWQIKEKVRFPTLTADGSILFHPSFSLWKTPLKAGYLYKIRTRTGREVMTSETHPFLTSVSWKEAKFLKLGEKICIVRKISIEGRPQSLPKINSPSVDIDDLKLRNGKKYSIKLQRKILKDYFYQNLTMSKIGEKYHLGYQIVQLLIRRYKLKGKGRVFLKRTPCKTTPEFWRWLGYIYAEGWFEQTKTSFRIWWANNDPEIQKDFIRKTQELFGITPHKRSYDGCFYFDNLALKDFFSKLSIPLRLKAGNKTVPPLLYKCLNREIAEFLGGYFDGDGGIGKDGLHIVTKSKHLAEDCQFLCQRLGVVTFMKSFYRYLPSNRKLRRRYYQISIYGFDLVVLSQKIRLICSEKQKKLNSLIRKYFSGKKPSNWDTIPWDQEVFQKVRVGLNFTQESTGKPWSVNAIENGYQLPTRNTASYFLHLFKKHDVNQQFSPEIASLNFLANPDIAWDEVVSVKKIKTSVKYLYDVSLNPTENFIGNGIVLHNTHVFTTTTGAIKNYFGMLKTVRHFAHRYIHETIVDLLTIQKEIHPGIFAVMDGTIVGSGSGPRAMKWHEKGYLLASHDCAAIDATAAKMMGFNPLEIPYLKLSQEKNLGVVDPKKIKIIGENIDQINFHFQKADTLASKGQKLIYHHTPPWFEKFLLQTVIAPWSYMASNLYHDYYWYNFVGKKRINAFMKTKWGELFKKYSSLAQD